MRSSHFLLFIVILLLPACAPKYGGFCTDQQQPADLDQWVDEQLIPYLAERLGRYPRFKGQPIYLVGLEGDNIRAELDGLTLSIRDRVKAKLHGVAGVNLAWRPQIGGKASHGSLADAPSRESEKLTYYIGFELRKSPYGNRISIQVRALDLNEQSWVDGFGICWEGTLSSTQEKLARRSQMDPSLLGMRVFPFTRQQPDLTAAHVRMEQTASLAASQQDQPLLPIVSAPPVPAVNIPANLSQNQSLSFIPEAAVPVISNRAMIEQFEIIVPNVSQLCNSTNPWLMGERLLAGGESLQNGDCIGLQIMPATPAYLILLHQDEFGQISTLRNTWQSGEGMIFPGVGYRFPRTDSGDALLLDGYSGREWLHAITISDTRLAADFEKMVLPGMNTQTLHTLLAELQGNHGQVLDYQSIDFMHR